MVSAPEEAVQIVRKILGPVPYRGTDRAVVDALSDAGWLRDPAEVAALRAVADKAHALDRSIGQWAGVALSPEVAKAWAVLEDALDNLPRRGRLS